MGIANENRIKIEQFLKNEVLKLQTIRQTYTKQNNKTFSFAILRKAESLIHRLLEDYFYPLHEVIHYFSIHHAANNVFLTKTF